MFEAWNRIRCDENSWGYNSKKHKGPQNPEV